MKYNPKWVAVRSVAVGAGLASQFLSTPSQRGESSQLGENPVQVYRRMNTMLRRRHASRTRTVVRRRRRRGGGGGMGGVLGPPIPPPKPPMAYSKFAKYGSYGQDESYSYAVMPEVCYLGLSSAKVTGQSNDTTANSSWSGSVMYHVAAALLRHILKKEHGTDIVSHDQVIDVNEERSKGSTLVFIWKKEPPAGFLPTYGQAALLLHTGSEPRMFGDVAKEIVSNVFGSTDFGGIYDANGYVAGLYGYYLAVPDALDATSVQRVTPIRRLDDQYIVAYSTSEMCLQNITQADNTALGEGALLDNRIDANPLDVAMYKFSTPMPKVKADGIALVNGVGTYFSAATLKGVAGEGNAGAADADNSRKLEFDRNGDGIIFPSASLTRDWRQLPSPDRFVGCTGYGRFKLQPGEIRKFKLHFKFEGTINKFIQGFKVISAGDSSQYNGPGAFGTSVLFAAEKVMSSGADSNVQLNYQASFWAGAYLKKKKAPVIQSYNHTGTYNPATGVYTAGTYVAATDA